jgi:hypothetical protein
MYQIDISQKENAAAAPAATSTTVVVVEFWLEKNLIL